MRVQCVLYKPIYHFLSHNFSGIILKNTFILIVFVLFSFTSITYANNIEKYDNESLHIHDHLYNDEISSHFDLENKELYESFTSQNQTIPTENNILNKENSYSYYINILLTIITILISWILSSINELRLKGDKCTYEKSRWAMSNGKRYYYSTVEEYSANKTEYNIHQLINLIILNTFIGFLAFIFVSVKTIWVTALIYWTLKILTKGRVKERLQHTNRVFLTITLRVLSVMVFLSALFTIIITSI